MNHSLTQQEKSVQMNIFHDCGLNETQYTAIGSAYISLTISTSN
jgi:hypothetical protein